MWTVIYIHSQGMYDGSAEEDSLSSSCQGLEDICTRTYAPIHVNLTTTLDSFDNFGQNINLHWMVMNVYKYLRTFFHVQLIAVWSQLSSRTVLGWSYYSPVRNTFKLLEVLRNHIHIYISTCQTLVWYSIDIQGLLILAIGENSAEWRKLPHPHPHPRKQAPPPKKKKNRNFLISTSNYQRYTKFTSRYMFLRIAKRMKYVKNIYVSPKLSKSTTAANSGQRIVLGI